MEYHVISAHRERYEVLDGMRGVAAICVMLMHYMHPLGITLFNTGEIAVDFFFILSGFVITHSYGERLYRDISPADYLIKRLIRLYPMFFVGLLFGATSLYLLIQNHLSEYSIDMLKRSLAANILYAPYFSHAATQWLPGQDGTVGEIFPTNPPAWSLFFEMVASIAFVILCRFSVGALTSFVLANFILFIAMAFEFNSNFKPFGFNIGMGWGEESFIGGFPRVLYSFALGTLLYRIMNALAKISWIENIRKWTSHSYLIYGLLVATLAIPITLKGSIGFIVLLTIAPYLVYSGARTPCNSQTTLQTAIFLGWISYPLYCIHYPIGRAVFLLASKYHYSNVTAFIAASFLSVMGATIITYTFDQPVRAYLSNKSKFLTSRKLKKA